MQDADKADQTGVTVEGQPDSDATLTEEAFSGSAAGRWLEYQTTF